MRGKAGFGAREGARARARGVRTAAMTGEDARSGMETDVIGAATVPRPASRVAVVPG